MAGNKTFTMIKPSAVEAQYTGKIISIILENGFKIRALKLIHLSSELASGFYAEHKGKPFFDSLVEFMSSGPIVAAILEKENAVEEYRALIGPTNPAQAPEGSIRKLFGKSVQENAVHGSDSDASADRECNYFFSALERY
ncbi:MAG: nucleoside-diphosphate kinase [Bacteroidales bacterium]|jgi:nucleoside-diphosphate kinase|nr:nucleoside-diphosphate kinase [Bacteroidales bacterium]